MDSTPKVVSLIWLVVLAFLGLSVALFTNRMPQVLGQDPEYLGPVGRSALRILGVGVLAAALYSLLSGNFPHVR